MPKKPTVWHPPAPTAQGPPLASTRIPHPTVPQGNPSGCFWARALPADAQRQRQVTHRAGLGETSQAKDVVPYRSCRSVGQPHANTHFAAVDKPTVLFLNQCRYGRPQSPTPQRPELACTAEMHRPFSGHNAGTWPMRVTPAGSVPIHAVVVSKALCMPHSHTRPPSPTSVQAVRL